MSKIPWTEKSQNATAGCTKCSPGCLNCYAERRAYRLACMALADIRKGRNPGLKKYYLEVVHMDGPNKGKWNGRVVCIPEALEIPLHWRKPRKIFVCSMSDLFHPKVPFGFIEKVMTVIENCPQHTFQILTKRPEIMLEYFNGLGKRYELSNCPNLHLGVSISTPGELWKAIRLREIPAAVKFVSFEPLLEDIQFVRPNRGEAPYGKHIIHYSCDEGFEWFPDWIIIGAESKGSWPGRHCDNKWVKNIVDQCVAAGVAVFVKQLHLNGELLKYPKDIKKFPPGLRRQEYPK